MHLNNSLYNFFPLKLLRLRYRHTKLKWLNSFFNPASRNNKFNHSKWKINWRLIVIGLAALALGAVLYIYDRPASHIYFVPNFLSQYKGEPVLFGFIGYYMPTFLHVFSFCLISIGILGSEQGMESGICLFWLLVDGAFEIAQHHYIADEIIHHIPDWFKFIPILENTKNYFINGRFDPADLTAILLGTITAYIFIYIMNRKNQN